MDDRDVEPLGEVAGVPRRAAFGGIGGEADLVVRDQVQRAAGRVAGETLDVQRLRDDALAGERRVAVDQDRKRDTGVVDARPRRAVRLLGPGTALDHRVDGLQMAWVRAERDRDLARRGLPHPFGPEVVLDVAGAAFRIGGDCIDRSLALELAQDRLVGLPDRVREHAQPAAVGHPHHGLVRARFGGERDCLVEHRHHHVEALDRELLLAEERPAQVALEAFDLREPLEQALPLVGAQRLPVAARLDRLPQPYAPLVVGDVLDFVRDRPAVGRAQAGERIGERLAGDVEPEERGGDPRLQLGRQFRHQALGVKSRIADRLRAEWVEARREVAVHPVRLDQRHRRGHPTEEQIVGRRGDGADGRGRRGDRRATVAARGRADLLQ